MGSDVLLVLIVILIQAIVWRGPKTLPKLGAALGRGVREAKVEASKAQAEIQTRTGGDDATNGPVDPPATPDANAPSSGPPGDRPA
jgi:Sec-independent protein translocase protein TatA